MSELLRISSQQSQNNVITRLLSQCISPPKAKKWIWQYFKIYKNQIDPTIVCCNICMGKTLSDYQHPETPNMPAEAYWELSYGKEKSTTKLDQHFFECWADNCKKTSCT